MRRIRNTIIVLVILVLLAGGLVKFEIIPEFWHDTKLGSNTSTESPDEYETVSENKQDKSGSESMNGSAESAEYGSAGDEDIINVNANGYPDWLQKMVSLNPETVKFAEEYKNRDEHIGKPIDLSDDYAKGEVPFLLQWDERWGYDYYGNDAIGAAGCGPTCLSMAYIYLTDDITGNPRKMAEYTYDNGFYTDEGTSWYLWTDGVSGLGLSGEELSFSDSTMKNALDSGALIICSMRPGDFTTTGHYILIRGYDENGFYVNDPNRVSTSEQQWTFDELDGQVKNLWTIRK